MAGGTGSGSGSGGGGSFGAFTLKGQAHGGRQPVTGATVSVYAAGNTGLGSASQLIASTTSDSNGNFYFGTSAGNAITCPSTTSTTASEILYIVASGGQPTTGLTNPQSIMIAPIGDCRTLENAQPFIAINEVSTVAAMAAMAPFFKPDTVNGGGSFGTTATNILGLTNASATATTLLNAVNAPASTLFTGASGYTVSGGSDSSITGATVTILAEQTKALLEANVLAACVNTTGTGSTQCNTIFSNVNGSGTAALDTLQAAYYMAVNPTDGGNIATVYGQAAPQAPYQPAASSVTDWTEGLEYATNSLGTATAGTGNFAAYLMGEPEYLAADGQGNIWIGNYTSGANTSNATVSSITELSPTGIPLKQGLVGAFGKTSGIIIDPFGNVFVADVLNGRTVEYTTSGATSTFATGSGTYALASDGSGNVFVANKTAGTIQEIPAGSASGTTPTAINTYTANYAAMAFDSYANLWLANGTGMTEFLKANNYTSGTTSATTGAYETIAIDPSNNAWAAIYGTTTGAVTKFPASNTASVGAGTSYSDATGIYDNKQVLSDSAGNIFLANSHTTTGGLVEFNNSGTLVSPAAGFGGHNYSYTYGETIDQAGNVWVSAGNASSSTVKAYILEIVGVAAPTVAPLAAQLPVSPSAPGTTKPSLLFSSLPSAFETVGAAFTYSPVVSASNPATATGTFSLTINGTTICAVAGPFAAGSTITCPVGATTLPVGTYTLAAVYSGDATYAPSSTPISLNVEPATATITNAGMTGHAVSGSAPIIGATVTLWATANNGIPVTSNPTTPVDVGAGYYNGQATLLASTTSTASGFTLPAFACSDPDQLYITVSGGETSGTVSNSAILLLAALGKCSTASALSPYVNEVTTVAAAYTLAGFTTIYNGNVHITASANNYATSTQTTGTMYHPVGLQHAFLNAANLADVTTGLAKTALAGYPVSVPTNSSAPVTSTVSPILPTALLNSVANTFAACTQTAGNCSAILAAAVPLSTATTLPVPTTILGAALNIARNPYMNGAGKAATWLGLASGGSAPYSPVITPTNAGTTTATPHDLTAAIFYPKSTYGNLYGLSATLDANDNFYTLSEESAASPYVYEMTGNASNGANLYTHQYCAAGTAGSPGYPTCAETVVGGEGLAADQLGNLWMVGNGTTTTTGTYAVTQSALYQLNASTGAFNSPVTAGAQESVYYAYGYSAWAIALDQKNDIFIGETASADLVYEYVNASATPTTSFSFAAATLPKTVANCHAYSYQVQFDAQGNLFCSGESSTANTNFVTVLPNQSLTSSTYPGVATSGAYPQSYITYSGTTAPSVATTGDVGYGVAVDSLGNVYEGSSTATAGATTDGLNVLLRSGMTYTNNIITALSYSSSSFINGAAASTTNGLVNTAMIRPEVLSQDGDGAILVPDAYLDSLVRVYGPTGTSVLVYYPCYGNNCAAPYASGTGIYGAHQAVTDGTGTITVMSTSSGFAQFFGIGTPSFPLLQAGHPAQMP